MKIVLDIPQGTNLGMSEFDLKMVIGVSLCDKGVMSSGFAAEVLGISLEDFILNMGKYGKSFFVSTEDELKEDMLVASQSIR